MNRDLDIGDRVVLSVDSVWIGKRNPTDCAGTITEVDGWVYVEWDNGYVNAYKGTDSDLIKVRE